MLRFIRCLALVFLVAVSIPLSAAADERIGVVLLHGKEGGPQSRITLSLIEKMDMAGFLLSVPELPWSRRRIYDATYEAAMDEITREVAALRAKGATRIVVAGQSLGANAAIGYAALRGGIDGVVACAPGHLPDVFTRVRAVVEDVDTARSMIANGRGDAKATFHDLNTGRRFTVETTARIYASYFDPDGPAVIPRNAARMRPGIPLLWIVGTEDRMAERGRAYAFDEAPSHPKSAYVEVEADHKTTADVGADRIVAWIKSLR